MSSYTERVKARLTEASLQALAISPDGLSAAEIRDHLPDADPGLVSRVLKSLVKAGVIGLKGERHAAHYYLP